VLGRTPGKEKESEWSRRGDKLLPPKRLHCLNVDGKGSVS
jgi:hypothetical protein